MLEFANSSLKTKFQSKINEILQIIFIEILCRQKGYEFFEENIIETVFEIIAKFLSNYKQEFFKFWHKNEINLKMFAGITKNHYIL